MRTQDEILERHKNCQDFLGTQKGDLLNYMNVENIKGFLTEDGLKELEAGKLDYPTKDLPKDTILDYLEFAYGKAENQRGISAGRSMAHFKTWIWMDDPVFYAEIIEDIDNYDDYGIPVLDRISEHYGFVKK